MPPDQTSVQTCWTCANALFSPTTTYCPIFGESILNEVLAGSDCPAYTHSEDSQ